MKPKIVVVGSANVDLVASVQRLPRPGETVADGTFLRSAGGKGANQAVAAARQGAAVTFVGRVGGDELGAGTLDGLREEGIDVRHVTRDAEAPTGVALIMVDSTGENSIAVAPGANSRLSAEHVEAARVEIESADVLLLQLEIPPTTVEVAARIARMAGVRVVLNPAPSRPLSNALLALVDVLTPNAHEARALAGIAASGADPTPEATAALIRRRFGGAIVITLGAEGALVADAGRVGRVPGFRVDAVDSTAAGDAFNGALAAGLASGQDLHSAVLRSCAAGALAATRRGARPSLPSREEVDSLIDDR